MIFVLDIDDSNANDQAYYLPFQQYCYDKETSLHVYRYLMSIDILSCNLRSIPETEEKQLYGEKAIPKFVRFVQNYVENAIENDTWEVNHYRLPDMFFVLFEAFCTNQ